jgi:site-specific DNA-methyltransferase (adenine-specific)
MFQMMEYNQIYNGDCLDIMKSIPDNFIDLILADLPYGSTQCKWDIIIPFEILWPQLNRIIKKNGNRSFFWYRTIFQFFQTE